eukprot:TRINITY_DN5919_c0_g1_i1.p1 TRINITY_DN5919_c0_g1~~TRINITY_DN5919_c0_g1_i1.p1  ORF type:complete len:336 (+),score=43.86 TRINITY_DN5919_c0_g1_i1:124-1131(+)
MDLRLLCLFFCLVLANSVELNGVLKLEDPKLPYAKLYMRSALAMLSNAVASGGYISAAKIFAPQVEIIPPGEPSYYAVSAFDKQAFVQKLATSLPGVLFNIGSTGIYVPKPKLEKFEYFVLSMGTYMSRTADRGRVIIGWGCKDSSDMRADSTYSYYISLFMWSSFTPAPNVASVPPPAIQLKEPSPDVVAIQVQQSIDNCFNSVAMGDLVAGANIFALQATIMPPNAGNSVLLTAMQKQSVLESFIATGNTVGVTVTDAFFTKEKLSDDRISRVSDYAAFVTAQYTLLDNTATVADQGTAFMLWSQSPFLPNSWVVNWATWNSDGTITPATQAQ